MPLPSLRAALVALAIAAVGLAVTATWAAFSSTTSNPSGSFTAKRIFPGTRTTAPWDERDASTGTETNVSSLDAFVDARYRVTTAWSNAFASNRYVDFDFSSPLPTGLSVSGATFDFDYARTGGSGSVCFYFEVRRASTNTVIATHGSAGSPVDCNATTTIESISTPLPELASSDVANDLRIRVFASHSASSTMRVDRATVGGSTYAAFTLYSTSFVDAADSTPAAAVVWELVAAEGTADITSNWTTAFGTARYVKFAYPAYLPAGASVTSASWTHTYRSNRNASDFCYYIEVFDGATLIGTHGSSGTPISCNASNVTWVTDTVLLPEVNTASEANNVVIKLYGASSSPARPSEHDRATLSLDYFYD